MSRPALRFAVFRMADGPGAFPAAEAVTATGALQAIEAMANEGAPGWYVVVNRDPSRAATSAERVTTFHAPEGVRLPDLYSVPAHRPWIEAARETGEVRT